MSVVQVLGAVVLVALVALFVFWRRRDIDVPESGTVLPPAAPRAPRGFRLLDGSDPEEPHPIVLPKIDPLDHVVIGENPIVKDHVTSPASTRHDESWALARSLRKSPHPRSRRRRRQMGVGVLVLLALLGALTWWLWPGSVHPPLGLMGWI